MMAIVKALVLQRESALTSLSLLCADEILQADGVLGKE